MKRLVFKNDDDVYSADVDRMSNIMKEMDYKVDRKDLVAAWEAHSESFAAGWLSMRDSTDESVFDSLMSYLKEV